MTFDLCDIVESHTKQDSLWAEELAKVTNTTSGQVQRFIEHPIKAWVVLQQISANLVKYRVHVVEIREICTAPMEQHRVPYTHTFEELFINWSEYEKYHLIKVIP
jgi:hypothetical protein